MTSRLSKVFLPANWSLKLRYAPNEKFFQTQWNRFPVSLDAPVFTLTHTMAAKGVLGGDYTYHYTEGWFSEALLVLGLWLYGCDTEGR